MAVVIYLPLEDLPDDGAQAMGNTSDVVQNLASSGPLHPLTVRVAIFGGGIAMLGHADSPAGRGVAPKAANESALNGTDAS